MEARASAWAKAVEKLRARQAALTERAACVQAPGEDSKQAQRGGAHAARRLNALNESEIRHHPAKRSHGHRDVADAGRMRACAMACPASRCARMSSSAVLRSANCLAATA